MDSSPMTPLQFTCAQPKRYRFVVTSLLVAVVVCIAGLFNLERSRDFFRADGVKDLTEKVTGGLHVTTTVFSAIDDHLTTIHCTWSPTSEEECLSLLSARLVPQRLLWLFFGDSTMGRLFQFSPSLKQALVKNPLKRCSSCNMTHAARCCNNEVFGLSIKENWTWVPPSPHEGPTSNGKKNPHCLDCSGCLSRFMTCPYVPCLEHMGAYFSVEFARDVELQSQEYNTTQENVVHFLKQWMVTNTSATSNSTTCILNFAIHDMTISSISDATYYDNIEWFLELLDPICGHFVWIHTTAPKTDHHLQKAYRIQIWNEGVLQLLMTPHWKQKSTVVDVFNASKYHPYIGNIHLEDNWYITLGDMFAKLV